MARRLKFRRKVRKWQLLKVLIAHGLCPLKQAELETRKRTGAYPLGNRAFLDWLKATDASNPYCDRAATADGKVAPFTLGRALYHIAQRRGFKSSRKDAPAETDGEDGTKKPSDKKLGIVKADIARLTEEIAASGAKTLGQHFFRLLEAEKGQLAKTRVRCRYMGRIEHYEKEFAVIEDVVGLPGRGRRRGRVRSARRSPSSSRRIGRRARSPARPHCAAGDPIDMRGGSWYYANC